MRNKAFKYVLVSAVLMLLGAAFSAAAREPAPQFVEALGVPAAGSGIVIEPKGATGAAVYIVRLEDAPLASYHGGVQGLGVTSPSAAGSNKLDVNRADSVAYRDYLALKQTAFLTATEQTLGREVNAIYQYDVAYNGVAMTMTPAEASSIAKQPGVVTVQRDQWRQAQTDVSPAFIGADKVWDGSGVPGVGTKGDGVIVGVIDTGIWPEHPSFDDDGSYAAPPVSWNGECQPPGDATQPLTCTNKLIGAKYFLSGYNSAVGGYDGLFFSARDDNGHGTHTASTAAGNENVDATLLGVDRGKISGVAPRAYVAAYKGFGPQGGVTSDLLAAIDAAVADGVDVINYSGGGGASDPWTDVDALAFLAARNTGVFVATSAGNAGPGANSVGSPGNSPWITTVGASSSNRLFISDITLIGPGDPPANLYGASVTGGVTDFNLVDAEGIADSYGDASGLCISPYPAGTFEATDVVLCKRGWVARVVRGDNVKAGGGGGVILYNADPAQGLATDNYVIPAVHVVNATGVTIKDYLTAHPGEVTVSFTDGEKALAGSDARVKSDMMADFSSRGPNGTVLDVIKPDVTAPGVQILAGNTPQCMGPGNRCGAPDQLFQAIQGTSMSSPHVAGAGALVAAVHPDWSPSEIESALMTTANTKHVKEDGSTQADPFDMGGGRIDVPMAANAPLVLHETNANYLAADPASGGDPKTLNNASLGNSSCVSQCSWTRTVRNSTAHEVTWDASVMGFSGSVSPASFTLAPGATQTFTAMVNVAGLEDDVWAFGSVEIVPQTGGSVPGNLPFTRLPIAVKPEPGSLQEEIVIKTRRDTGSYLMADLSAFEITEMTLNPYGLVPGKDSHFYLMQDTIHDDAYDDLSQVWYKIAPVPANSMRFVNEILDSTAPEADMFVGFDDNGNGKPDGAEQVCESTTNGWNEQCNIDMPKAGNWWVLVQNWDSSTDDAYDSIRLATAVVPGEDSGSMTFDAPKSVPMLEPFDINVKYDLVSSYAGQAWFGSFSVGADAGNPGNVGKVNVDLYRYEDDVVKSADKQSVMPGDKVTFTIVVNSNVLDEDVDYEIVDMIPDGLTYVAGSAEASAGTVAVAGSKLTWIGTLSVRPYNMSTSVEDEMCDTGFDGYVNLADFDIFTQAGVVGDRKAYGFFGTGNPINFYGVDYPGMHITDDGFALFDFDNNYGGEPGTPQEIPNVNKPSNLAAMLWQDMEIVYDAATNKGVSAATVGDNVMIVEYDDIQIFEDDTNTYDFEIVMTRAVDDTPGAYEIVFAYDNLNGSMAGPLTIGVENADGDNAVAFENNGSATGNLTNGMMICFDSVEPSTDVTIIYEVTVDDDVKLGDVLLNMVKSTTSNVNSKEELTYAGVYVGYPTFNPIILALEPK